MRDALRFWSEDVGVDGFRCDYAVGVPTDFWAVTIAEMNAARPNSPLLWFAEAEAPSLHDAGFELTYSWQGFGSIQGVIAGSDLPESVYSSYLNEVAAIPEHCRKLRFVTNHDETSWNAPAPTMYGGVAAMQCAQAITAFLPGVPLVYNGQEVGCNQVLHLFEDVPIDWSTHPELRAWYTSLLTTRAQHEAFQGTALSFHPAENLFVAERVDGTGTARALLVVNVRNFAQDFNFAAWTASDWTEAFTGNAMPATSNLGPFAIRLYVR
jgi:glycosidase